MFDALLSSFVAATRVRAVVVTQPTDYGYGIGGAGYYGAGYGGYGGIGTTVVQQQPPQIVVAQPPQVVVAEQQPPQVVYTQAAPVSDALHALSYGCDRKLTPYVYL